MKEKVSGKTKRGVVHRIKRADIVLIAVCLLAAAMLAVFFVFHREAGSSVRIMYDGIELKKIDLYSAEIDNESDASSVYYLITYRGDAVSVECFSYKPELKLPEGTGYNLISVTDETIVVEMADCKDQICVRHKPISSKGESIICLPHRLVVEIVSENSAVNIQDKEYEEMPGKPLDGVVR